MTDLRGTVILIGFMGTGKTAVGRALARQWNAEFWDTDAEIERRTEMTIAQIFAMQGEPYFRSLETRLLQEWATPISETAPRRVIATGGGMPLRPENQTLLRRIGTVVWLTASAPQILQRVGPEWNVRPLLATAQADPMHRIVELLAVRTPHYEAASDMIWDTGRFYSSEEAAASLLAQLCQPVTLP